MATRSKKDQEEARDFLRSKLAPGDTLYTSVKHVSRSGMQRSISVYRIEDNEPWDISGFVAKALGWPLDDKRFGVKVGGCGMDMGFHLVYSLSYVLFPKGYGCVGERCPSNDHSNGDRDYTPHEYATIAGPTARPHWHADGGYALIQRWI